MALDTAPILTKQRRFAFKLETTTGTKATLATTDAKTVIFNPSIVPDIEGVDRENIDGLSELPQSTGACAATATFEHELYNGSSGVPAWTDLLKACGMTLSTATFSPSTQATNTLTFGLFRQNRGALYLLGGMGSWKLMAERGKAARMSYNFRGAWGAPTTTTLSAPAYQSTAALAAPRVGAATFTIGGTTYRVPQVEIEYGNEIIVRQDITATDGTLATGYRAAYITRRATRVRVAPEALSLSTKDWFDFHRSLSTAALSLVIGATANQTFTFAAPKLQLVSPPTEDDRDGMLVDSLEFKTVRNSDGGDDDITIALS